MVSVFWSRVAGIVVSSWRHLVYIPIIIVCIEKLNLENVKVSTSGNQRSREKRRLHKEVVSADIRSPTERHDSQTSLAQLSHPPTQGESR